MRSAGTLDHRTTDHLSSSCGWWWWWWWWWWGSRIGPGSSCSQVQRPIQDPDKSGKSRLVALVWGGGRVNLGGGVRCLGPPLIFDSARCSHFAHSSQCVVDFVYEGVSRARYLKEVNCPQFRSARVKRHLMQPGRETHTRVLLFTASPYQSTR